MGLLWSAPARAKDRREGAAITRAAVHRRLRYLAGLLTQEHPARPEPRRRAARLAVVDVTHVSAGR